MVKRRTDLRTFPLRRAGSSVMSFSMDVKALIKATIGSMPPASAMR